MANADLQWLKDRFRSAVDDLDIDPTDQSGLLWSDDDVLDYIDAAHSQFVHDTLYRHSLLQLNVVAGDPIIPLSDEVIELRGTMAYLVGRDVQIAEINLEDTASVLDDYGTEISVSAFSDQPPGIPRAFSLDMEADEIRLYPASDTDDTLQVATYVEARQIYNWDVSLDVTNRRHVRMLLDGIKARAYDKQDADAYDPNQAQKWQAIFDANIEQVKHERQRRARRPPTIRYGGL